MRACRGRCVLRPRWGAALPKPLKGGEIIAIYHCSIKIIKRSEGRSAVAAAAYRSGERLVNEWDGMTHDYTKKGGIVHSEIILPAHAPQDFQNRSTLWNSIEQVEKSRNAQLAREVEIALPVELDRTEQIALVRTYIKDAFVATGMCADFAIHDKGDGNPHAHILLTLRPLEHDGTWGAKCRKEYLLDENGQRIPDGKGCWKNRRINTTDWNDKDKSEQWRSAWAKYSNRALEQKGIQQRIDHRSYVRQGIKKIPTVHMGVAASQMEHRGINTDKGNVNREIVAQNKLLKEIKARITRLYNWSKEQTTQPEDKSIMAQLWQSRQETVQSDTLYGKIKALKENATLLSFLQTNGISSMQELHEKVNIMQTDYYALRGKIRDTERQISTLTERLDMWEKFEKHKGIHHQLVSLKPNRQDEFSERHRAELTLYESANRYLKELQKSGEKTIPKKWRSEIAALSSQKDNMYEQMKSMRKDIQSMEQLRKAADSLNKTQKSKEQEHEI